jgi:tetratricopeptide (TPR) repeat protein
MQISISQVSIVNSLLLTNLSTENLRVEISIFRPKSPIINISQKFVFCLFASLIFFQSVSPALSQDTNIRSTVTFQVNTQDRDYQHDLETPIGTDQFEANSSSQSILLISGLTLFDRVRGSGKIGYAAINNGAINISGDTLDTDGDLGFALGAEGQAVILEDYLGFDWTSGASYLIYESDFGSGVNEVEELEVYGGLSKTIDRFTFQSGLRYSEAEQTITGTTQFGAKARITSEASNNFGAYFLGKINPLEYLNVSVEANFGDRRAFFGRINYSFDPLSLLSGSNNSKEESKSPSESKEKSESTWKDVLDNGLQSYDQGNYDKARELLLEVLDKYPGHINSLIYLGLTELQLDSVDRQTAISRFELVLDIDPDNERAKGILKSLERQNDTTY